MAPATSDAVWARNVSTPSSNSRGASVCRTTVPRAEPERAGIGTATIDWKRSSSISGTYFMRGSVIACSRMNSGVPLRATQPASPSSRPISTCPTRCAYTCDAARSRSRSPSRRYTKQAWQCVASVRRSTTPSSTRSRSGDDATTPMTAYRVSLCSATRSTSALRSIANGGLLTAMLAARPVPAAGAGGAVTILKASLDIAGGVPDREVMASHRKRRATAADAGLPPRAVLGAEALSALAVPARLALLNHPPSAGACTASQCAPVVGESASNCSWHLRALEKVGLVERAPRAAAGDARTRPWQATAVGFEFGAEDGPAQRVARTALAGLVAEHAD